MFYYWFKDKNYIWFHFYHQLFVNDTADWIIFIVWGGVVNYMMINFNKTFIQNIFNIRLNCYHIGTSLRRDSYINPSNSQKCWKGCGQLGIYLHCWRDCIDIDKFWQEIVELINKIKGL